MKLTRDLKEFIELLNSRGVEYLLIGGWAFAFHATPRYTGDIDFFLKCDGNNAARLKNRSPTSALQTFPDSMKASSSPIEFFSSEFRPTVLVFLPRSMA